MEENNHESNGNTHKKCFIIGGILVGGGISLVGVGVFLGVYLSGEQNTNSYEGGCETCNI